MVQTDDAGAHCAPHAEAPRGAAPSARPAAAPCAARPARPTRLQLLLVLLSRGWVSAADAYQALGTMTLAQRICELAADGVPIEREWRAGAQGTAQHRVYRLGCTLDEAREKLAAAQGGA